MADRIVFAERTGTAWKCPRCGHPRYDAGFPSVHAPGALPVLVCADCARVEKYENRYDGDGNLVAKGACGDLDRPGYWLAAEVPAAAPRRITDAERAGTYGKALIRISLGEADAASIAREALQEAPADD